MKVCLLRFLFLVFAVLLTVVLWAGLACAVDSRTPPQGYVALLSQPVNAAVPGKVLLIQDVLPWNSSANQTLLASNGIAYTLINSSAISATDFSSYSKIILASDQPQSFYDSCAANKSKFDTFVSNGGMLEWHMASYGWQNGNSGVVVLPAGVGTSGQDYQDNNYVDIPSNPLVAGVPNPFPGSSASHNILTNTSGVTGLAVITTTGNVPGGNPTLIQYPFGSGCVVASGQTFEYGYNGGEAAGTILQNLIPYFCGATNNGPRQGPGPSFPPYPVGPSNPMGR